MALHPVIQSALAAASDLPAYYELPINEARAQARLGYPAKPSPVPVGAVRNFTIPGPDGPIPSRLYLPPSEPGPAGHPMLVFFHGSGFVLLDLDTHDDLCRRLCAGASCLVLSVDYRLAPEHKFPAAPDDCLAATRWAAEHALSLGGDASRIAVAGDSAGGNLAAVTALRIREQGGPRLCGQLLFYPVTDFPSEPSGSYLKYGEGFGLTREGMLWFWRQYLAEPGQAGSQLASPLRAASLAGLPSACVLTAEYDVLHDEGQAFAQRLREAGVPAFARSYGAMNHGFLKYAGAIDEADAAVRDGCNWLKGVFAGPAPVSMA
jgi:acetyl esterase